MDTYFATFPAGTFDLIAKQLKRFKLEELKILEHDNSSLLFASLLAAEKLMELRYFTNVYLVVDDQSLPKAIKGKYYRLMLLKNGAPQQMDAAQRAKLETRLQRDYKLEPNTHLSKNNFYLIERSSGKRLFTLKLSRTKRQKQSVGELRPELAHILCLAAGVKAKHAVLDIFAGYGSIPFEAVRGFGCKQVIAVDNQKLPNRHEHKFINWLKGDARKLDHLSDDSIDRVVTDPPWGIYDTNIGDLADFYRTFTREIERVLKPDGVAVMLIGYDGAEKVFEQEKALSIIGKWNVLVSGKKATIYKLQKRRDRSE